MGQLYLILPQSLLFLTALVVLLLGSFAGSELIFATIVASLIVSLICGVMLSPSVQAGSRIFSDLLYFDPLSLFACSLIIIATLACVVFARRQIEKEGVDYKPEFYALLLFSAFGACIFSMAAHVAVFFIAVEIMSLALYCLCGSSINRSRSSEAAMKYFIIGSVSSAIMMYGFALIYTITGKLDFNSISIALANLNSPLVLVAVALTSVGVLMKLSAVPFHFWTADVYQGAPSTVTAFMASAIKLASFAAAIRVFWFAFGSSVAFWSEFLPAIAVLTMTVGTLMAIRQTNLKRMLAFSSVAHSGYLMVGLMSGANDSNGIAALLFYLCLYVFMTLGAFEIVGALIADQSGNSNISILNGLSRARPTTALLLSFFILCLAGLPPGVAGLLSKVQLLSAGLKADYTWVVIVALINSAVGCFYYLRIIKNIYSVGDQHEVAPLERGLLIVSGSCFLVLLAFSIFPGVLMSFCSAVASISNLQ